MKLRRKGGNMLCTLWVYKYYLFSIKPCKGEIITPVSQIRQMRLGEVKRHTQNHTAREDKAGIFNPDISGSNISIFFFFTFFSIFFFLWLYRESTITATVTQIRWQVTKPHAFYGLQAQLKPLGRPSGQLWLPQKPSPRYACTWALSKHVVWVAKSFYLFTCILKALQQDHSDEK